MVKKAVAPAKKPAAAGATTKVASTKAAAATKVAPVKAGVSKAAVAAKQGSARAASPSPKNPPKEAVNKATSPKSTPTKSAAAKAAPEKAAATPASAKSAASTAKTPAKSVAATSPAKAAAKSDSSKKAETDGVASNFPPVKGETKDGIKYTKDFDAKFLAAQWKLLTETREQLTGQASRLEDEANSLIAEDMGDVQFDEESGEGDTMVVERERDLFLSARVRQDIEEIDSALRRLTEGTYGYSLVSYRPIPRERLEAIPWATELTEEKVGGIGRR